MINPMEILKHTAYAEQHKYFWRLTTTYDSAFSTGTSVYFSYNKFVVYFTEIDKILS